MKKRRKLAYWLGALGVAIAVAVFMHLEAIDYTPLSQTALVLTLMLCPAAMLSAGFIDIEPHSGTAAVAWLVIAVANGALYGVAGYAIGKYVWKSE